MTSYTILRSRRRTLALEITRDAQVLVRAPLRCPQKQIESFVASHEVWLAEHLARQQARKAASPPLPTAEELAALKVQTRQLVEPLVAQYAEEMGLTPTGIKITTARTRYGSCSGKNSLCFSCYLADCPSDAVELVVVHELCHIRHKNHGPAFYALLESILPDWKRRKALLTMR